MFKFCFNAGHTRDLMIMEARASVAESRLQLVEERVKDREIKIAALIAERGELIGRMMEMENFIRSGPGPSHQVAMPAQSRDWAHVAEAEEARAMLSQLKRERGE